MRQTKLDLPRGTPGLVNGYAIAPRLDEVSRGVVKVPQGSLYPALHRLKNRGLLAADWRKTVTGRETGGAGWQRLTDAVGLILNLTDGGGQ